MSEGDETKHERDSTKNYQLKNLKLENNDTVSYTRCLWKCIAITTQVSYHSSFASYQYSMLQELSLPTGDTSECLVAIVIIVVVGFIVATNPLRIPADLPGPKRYPYIGYLPHVLKHWHEWPTETTRLAKKYKRTWGGPLPNFGGLPGAYFYISHENNLQHILKTC